MKNDRLSKSILLGISLALLFNYSIGQTIKQGDKLVIGSIFKISSQILNEERPIWVYLPAGYAESTESYPVFYLLDGELQFHHVSGIIEFLSKFSFMPPMILIAIPNVDRERDFLSDQVDNWPVKAESGKFRAFLKDELMPLVEKKYRTRPFRILSGHSFGGVFCIETFLLDPDLFTTFIAISPSLDWNDSLLIKLAEQKLKDFSFDKKFLFLTTSADDMQSIPATKEFAKLLDRTSPKGLGWRFDFMENDDHLSVVHPSIYNALLWLHQGWRLSETATNEMTLKEVILHYENLSQRYGSPVPIPEGVLFNQGYLFMDKGQIRETIEVFEYAIKLYPDEAACYVGLAEVYESEGKLELAKKNLEIALKLAKKNNDSWILPVAKGMLDRVLKKIN